MSINSFRKPLALAASAVVLGGAGFGVAQASSSSTASTAPTQGQGPPSGTKPSGTRPATGSTGAGGAPGQGSGPGGDMAAKLAKQLGLSTATVQAALDAVRPAQGTTAPATA